MTVWHKRATNRGRFGAAYFRLLRTAVERLAEHLAPAVRPD